MRFRLFYFLLPIFCHATAGYFEPWGKNSDLCHKSTSTSKPSYSFGVRIADTVIRFHQDIISPVDGPRSHFRPTSSRYMQLAMHRHGFIKGFIMGCDRLLRENKDPWVYRWIEIDGQFYKYDPVRK